MVATPNSIFISFIFGSSSRRDSDPRVKLETLGYCYEQIDPLTWETKLENLKDKLYNLFSQYSAKSSTSSDVKRSSVSLSSTPTKRPHFDVRFSKHETNF